MEGHGAYLGKVRCALDQMDPHLRPPTDLDIGPLSGLFAETTNCYKIVFFRALLTRLVDPDVGDRGLPLRSLCIEAVVLGWYPRTYFKLSFGLQDKLAPIIDALDFDGGGHLVGSRAHTEALRAAITAQYDVLNADRLLRYVPYRLLQPFFRLQLQGIPEHAKNAAIARLAAASFGTSTPPLYRFEKDARIQIHPRWLEYIRASYSIVAGWCRSHWVDFLQRRNPGVPAIPTKALPPAQRAALTRQTNYWRTVGQHLPLNCLYSGALLGDQALALDHFVPWSFVCCDQLWNLAPVAPRVNSSKGNQLPHVRYLQRLSALQADALRVSREHMPENDWVRATESFVSDLKLQPQDLLVAARVREAYDRTVPALLALAKVNGFSDGWGWSVESTGQDAVTPWSIHPKS